MFIKVEVPDDVIMLHVHGCNYDGVIVKRGYTREQLQSMIVKDEPCEHCSIVEQKNDYGRTFYKEFPHDASMSYVDVHVQLAYSDMTGWVLHFENYVGDRMFDIKVSNCPSCGRKLRKDVNKMTREEAKNILEAINRCDEDGGGCEGCPMECGVDGGECKLPKFNESEEELISIARGKDVE